MKDFKTGIDLILAHGRKKHQKANPSNRAHRDCI
jgi:hypothetical protein